MGKPVLPQYAPIILWCRSFQYAVSCMDITRTSQERNAQEIEAWYPLACSPVNCMIASAAR
jgi:hypothetical protein